MKLSIKKEEKRLLSRLLLGRHDVLCAQLERLLDDKDELRPKEAVLEGLKRELRFTDAIIRKIGTHPLRAGGGVLRRAPKPIIAGELKSFSAFEALKKELESAASRHHAITLELKGVRMLSSLIGTLLRLKNRGTQITLLFQDANAFRAFSQLGLQEAFRMERAFQANGGEAS